MNKRKYFLALKKMKFTYVQAKELNLILQVYHNYIGLTVELRNSTTTLYSIARRYLHVSLKK